MFYPEKVPLFFSKKVLLLNFATIYSRSAFLARYHNLVETILLTHRERNITRSHLLISCSYALLAAWIKENLSKSSAICGALTSFLTAINLNYSAYGGRKNSPSKGKAKWACLKRLEKFLQFCRKAQFGFARKIIHHERDDNKQIMKL